MKKLDADLIAANKKKLEVDAAKTDADQNIKDRKVEKAASDLAYNNKKKEYDDKFKLIKPEQDIFDPL